MNIFALANDVIVEEERDTLGGFQPFEQDIYAFVIKAAYLDKSKKSEAQSINLLLETPEGKTYTHTTWITNGTGQNYYIDQKDGNKKKVLPGMHQMSGLSVLACGKSIDMAEKAEKVIKLYDYATKKDVPSKRIHIIDWHGKVIHGAMLKIIETKMAKDANGGYTIPTAEKRTVNEITKFFNSELMTLSESRLPEPVSAFAAEWIKANKGKERDKTLKNVPQAGLPAGVPAAAPLMFN